MATSTNESIPPELQNHVVSYVRRPTDLQSLSLTSKQMCGIARYVDGTPYRASVQSLAVGALIHAIRPYLYRRTVLHLDEWESK